MVFYIVVALLLVICMYLLSTISKLNSRIKELEYTVEQISKQVEIPGNPINTELRQLIEEGNDVKAVKKVRETLGLSLIEAKQYIDTLKFESK